MSTYPFILEIHHHQMPITAYFSKVMVKPYRMAGIPPHTLARWQPTAIETAPEHLTTGRLWLYQGFVETTLLWDWREYVVTGQVNTVRTNISLTMVDKTFEGVARWDFERAWASKVSTPLRSPADNGFVVNTLMIEFESMFRAF